MSGTRECNYCETPTPQSDGFTFRFNGLLPVFFACDGCKYDFGKDHDPECIHTSRVEYTTTDGQKHAFSSIHDFKEAKFAGKETEKVVIHDSCLNEEIVTDFAEWDTAWVDRHLDAEQITVWKLTPDVLRELADRKRDQSDILKEEADAYIKQANHMEREAKRNLKKRKTTSQV